MLNLSRTIRFHVNLADTPEVHLASPRDNTFSGWPARSGFSLYQELTATLRGQPDPTTRYLENVSIIDEAVRTHAIPAIYDAVRSGGNPTPEALLPTLLEGLRAHLDAEVTRLDWRFSPFHTIGMRASAMTTVLITQQFDFAAAHRLHSPDLSDEENARIFGKCNNAHYHGHNYRVEVAVASTLDPATGTTSMSLPELDRLTDEAVMQRLDHRNLNLDVPEFAEDNPSVERIAQVIWTFLDEPVREAGARLDEVSVWETEKTSCTVRRSDQVDS